MKRKGELKFEFRILRKNEVLKSEWTLNLNESIPKNEFLFSEPETGILNGKLNLDLKNRFENGFENRNRNWNLKIQIRFENGIELLNWTLKYGIQDGIGFKNLESKMELDPKSRIQEGIGF